MVDKSAQTCTHFSFESLEIKANHVCKRKRPISLGILSKIFHIIYTLKMYVPDLFHPEPPVSCICSHDQSYEHLKAAAKIIILHVAHVNYILQGEKHNACNRKIL